MKKVMEVMSQVWGIGKRRFRGNWKRRMELFDWLVDSVLGFGAEVWGWKEWEEVGRLQERYMRWVLRVDKRTPEYLAQVCLVTRRGVSSQCLSQFLLRNGD